MSSKQRDVKTNFQLMVRCLAIVPASMTKTGIASAQKYAIGLWGDLPYNTVQATVGVPNLIADMNSQKLAFTVNDGDLKAGGGDCTDSVYLQAIVFFNSLNAPAAFTPVTCG